MTDNSYTYNIENDINKTDQDTLPIIKEYDSLTQITDYDETLSNKKSENELATYLTEKKVKVKKYILKK